MPSAQATATKLFTIVFSFGVTARLSPEAGQSASESAPWYDAAVDDRTLKAELTDLFRELEEILKRPDTGEILTQAGVNTSIALVAAQGLAAYLTGDKLRAADDLATAAEEIEARLDAARERNSQSN